MSTRIQEDAANLRTTLETNYNGTNYPDLVAGSAPAANASVLDTNALSTGPNTNAATIKTDITSTEGGQLAIYDNCATSACTNASTITAYVIEVMNPGGTGFCVDSKGNTASNLTGTSFSSVASRGQSCPANNGAL